MKRKRKEKRKGKKWTVFLFFIIEAQAEEEHVCLCAFVLCSWKKVKHAPSRVRLHTQALNREQVGNCMIRGMDKIRRKALDIWRSSASG